LKVDFGTAVDLKIIVEFEMPVDFGMTVELEMPVDFEMIVNFELPVDLEVTVDFRRSTTLVPAWSGGAKQRVSRSTRTLISQKVLIKSFCQRQFLQKSIPA